MSVRFIIHGLERSLPTSVPYRSDCITSFTAEVDQEALAPSDLAAFRRAQLADLDAQEAVLRERYAMPSPSLVHVTEPGFTTADKLEPRATSTRILASTGATPGDLAKLRDAEATRTTPSPDAMRDVQDGTADELRRLAIQLAAIGAPVEDALPATEADAQSLLVELRKRIFDARHRPAPQAKAPVFEVPKEFRKPDGSDFTPGDRIMPSRRICADAAHPAGKPRFLNSLDWNTTNRVHGKGLCVDHVPRTEPPSKRFTR